MKKLTITTAFLLCAVMISHGQWTYTNLSGPKCRMGVATSGPNAYFAGGYTGTEVISLVEVYNVETGAWSTLGDLTVPRQAPSGVACGSKLFFGGGTNSSMSILYSTVDIYDISTGQWSSAEFSLARFDISAVSKGDTVLFAGGCNFNIVCTNVVDIYDITTNSWTTSNLSSARAGMASAIVGDLAVFAGGFLYGGAVSQQVDIYNFTTKTWSTASLSEARVWATAVTVNDKVIIAGGIKDFPDIPSDRVDIFNASDGTWTTDTLSEARTWIAGGVVHGNAYFAGGSNVANGGIPYNFTNKIDIYNAENGSWAADTLSLRRISQGLSIGDYLLVAGGLSQTAALSSVEIFKNSTLIHVPADYPTIQEGIIASDPGDTVLVADGLYYENINFIGRKPLMVASHFLMDGDTNHINNTIINGSQPVDPDKGSVVTFESGEDTTSVLCGFTITGGSGTIVPVASARMGGGVGIFYSGAKLIHNHIEYNTTTTEDWAVGGGLQAGGPMGGNPLPWIVLKDNRINHNQAISTGSDWGAGGGIICYYNLIMEDNEVSYNVASGHLGADGGGVNVAGQFGPIELNIRRNQIISNEAVTDLGTSNYAALGGGMSLYLNLSGIISDNIIENNTLEAPSDFWSYAPGVFIQEIDADNFIFENNLIRQNISYAPPCHGGGLCLFRTGGTYQNNVMQNNSASHGGGGFIEESQVINDTVILINNTIANNNATTGGGLYLQSSDVLIINSIIWGNNAFTSPSIHMEQCKLEVSYSDIEGEMVWPGEGNITLDPGFIDDSLHIDQFSPCTDSGAESVTIGGQTYYAPLYDLEGTPRPWYNNFDMGAYECNSVGVPEQEEQVSDQHLAVSIYPNPTTGKFQITNSKHQTNSSKQITNRTIEIVDFLGNVIEKWNMEHGTWNMELDISDLPSGIYFIRINVDNEMITGRIIKL